MSDFETGEPATEFGSGWEVSTDRMAGGGSSAGFTVTEGGAQGNA